MGKYVIRRLVQAIPVLIGISIVIYAIMLHGPGWPGAEVRQQPPDDERAEGKVHQGLGPRPADPDPVRPLDRPPATPTARASAPSSAQRLAELPADRASAAPTTASSTATSATRSTPASNVGQRIAQAALPTLILAGFALILWIGIAVLLGVLSAVRRYSFFDQAATVFAYVGFAMPTFWLGLMLIFLLGQKHIGGETSGFFPISGMIDTRSSPPFGIGEVLGLLRGQPGQGDQRHRLAPRPAGHHPRRGQHRRRLPVRPGEHARGAQPGLRPDGQGQGPVGPDGRRSSTRSGTRSCRSSRTSASRSRSCSPGRS